MTKENNNFFIKGKKDNWEVVIGLEVHAQVLSNSKLFSGSSTKFGANPNTQVSLIDSAFPGMLPVINEECVKQAVRTGLGLNAKIITHDLHTQKATGFVLGVGGYFPKVYKDLDFCPCLFVVGA